MLMYNFFVAEIGRARKDDEAAPAAGQAVLRAVASRLVGQMLRGKPGCQFRAMGRPGGADTGGSHQLRSQWPGSDCSGSVREGMTSFCGILLE